MGYMRHNVMVVVSWNRKQVDEAHAFATSLGMVVSPVVETNLNGVFSFYVAPDGSKEGWGASDDGDVSIGCDSDDDTRIERQWKTTGEAAGSGAGGGK